MKKYVKKPVLVEAIKLPDSYPKGGKLEDELDFLIHKHRFIVSTDGIIIPTLEGDMKASWGDYIIKGIKGEYYACKPNVFVESYSLVKE